MLSNYRYYMLSADDQKALMGERLHQLEASHFKLTIELRLAGVVGDADNELAAGVKVQLAAMEVQATALREWLGTKESADA